MSHDVPKETNHTEILTMWARLKYECKSHQALKTCLSKKTVEYKNIKTQEDSNISEGTNKKFWSGTNSFNGIHFYCNYSTEVTTHPNAPYTQLGLHEI